MTNEECIQTVRKYHEMLIQWEIDLNMQLQAAETRDERDKIRSQFLIENTDRYKEMMGLYIELKVFDLERDFSGDEEHGTFVFAHKTIADVLSTGLEQLERGRDAIEAGDGVEQKVN